MNKNINYNLYTNILPFFCFCAVFILVWCMFKTIPIFAAEDALTYTLLADLPEISEAPEYGDYLRGMIKLVIGITTMLSVLMIVYAGVIVQVGGAASPSARSNANKQIWGALLGLFLALISYVVLNEINPNLLSLDLNVDKVSGESSSDGFSGSPFYDTGEPVFPVWTPDCPTAFCSAACPAGCTGGSTGGSSEGETTAPETAPEEDEDAGGGVFDGGDADDDVWAF